MAGKTPVWKRFHKDQLSGGDMALFLCAFTAVFGILCYRPNGSIYQLLIFALFTGFWLVMAFFGGRRLVKGMWLTALLLWGAALVYALLNWYVVASLGNPESVNKVLAAILWALGTVAAALVNPVFPLLYRVGYAPSESAAENAVFLVVLVLICMAVVAAAFAAGWAASRRARRTDRGRGLDVPTEFRD